MLQKNVFIPHREKWACEVCGFSTELIIAIELDRATLF